MISSIVRWQPWQKSLAGFILQSATQGEATAWMLARVVKVPLMTEILLMPSVIAFAQKAIATSATGASHKRSKS